MSANIDKIVDGLLFLTILLITGAPNYETIANVYLNWTWTPLLSNQTLDAAHSAYFTSPLRAAFIPVISTWNKGIDSAYYTTWPGLTLQLVRKHLPKALATAHEHLCQQRGNVWSTKITTTPSINNNRLEMTMLPVPITKPCVRTKMAFLKFI